MVTDPPGAFCEEVNGQVVTEAEHFTWGNSAWASQVNLADYTGAGYLSALPDLDLRYEMPVTETFSPRLDYTINFTTPGIYTVWLRGYAPNSAGDSVYVSLNEQPAAPLTGFAPREWDWAATETGIPGETLTITISEPGIHTLHLWQREDGLRIDRMLLTTDESYIPTGSGPT